jgi:hypothetical protein
MMMPADLDEVLARVRTELARIPVDHPARSKALGHIVDSARMAAEATTSPTTPQNEHERLRGLLRALHATTDMLDAMQPELRGLAQAWETRDERAVSALLQHFDQATQAKATDGLTRSIKWLTFWLLVFTIAILALTAVLAAETLGWLGWLRHGAVAEFGGL